MTALTRLCTDGSHAMPSLRKIEWITFSTDRSVRKSASAIAALFLPSAISRSTSRSRGRQPVDGRGLDSGLLGDEALDHLRVDHRAAAGDGLDGCDELGEVVDPLLQQVRASGGPGLEQRKRVAGLAVLAEHDDADLRMCHSQALCGLDALVDAVRRHADVGEDDVGALGLDRCEQRVEVAARGCDLDLRLELEQATETLADEVVVIGEHDPDRHEPPRMTQCPSSC